MRRGLPHGSGMVTKRLRRHGGAGRACARAYRAAVEVVLWIALVAAGLAVGWIAASRRATGGGAAEQPERLAGTPRDPVDVEAIVDGVPVASILVDAQGRVLHANGRALAELPALRAGVDPGDVSASLAEILRRALAGELVATTERVLLDDPPRTLRVTVVRAGTGAIVSFYDVTEEADFEEARRTFSAAVSHELRTPLARILGLAETLALPDLDEDRVELVTQIEQEVDGIRKLIDEMLLLAALDRGRLAVADGVVDGSGVVRRVVDDALQRRIGRGREIRVEVEDGIEIPVAARLFEVVVQNLVDNALIHGGADAAVVVRLDGAGGEAVLLVTDTGVGIPAQHLPYVFQRFYRGDASRTGSGTGLGLALVKHIVEAHGGTVAAESDGASGSTFRVQLPLAS